MADQEDEPAATDLELPTDSSSEAESDSSSEAAPPSQARCTESSDSDDNDEMPSLYSRRRVLQRRFLSAEGPRSRAVLVEEGRRRRVRVQAPEQQS